MLFRYLSLLKILFMVMFFTVISLFGENQAKAAFPGAKIVNCAADGTCFGNCDPQASEDLDNAKPHDYMKSCESQDIKIGDFEIKIEFDPDQLFADMFVPQQSQKASIIALGKKTEDIKLDDRKVFYDKTQTTFEVIHEFNKACVYASVAFPDGTSRRYTVTNAVPTTQNQVKGETPISAKLGANPDDLADLKGLPTEFAKAHCVRAPIDAQNLGSPIWGSMISPVCTNYSLGSSQATGSFTGIVVECIEDSMRNLFSPRGSAASIVETVQKSLANIVRAVLALYIIIIGYRLMMGKRVPQRDEWGMYVIKLALVVYFTLGTGIADIYPKLANASKDLSMMVMNAGMNMQSNPALEKAYLETQQKKQILAKEQEKLSLAKKQKSALSRQIAQLQREFNQKLVDLASATSSNVTWNNTQKDTCASPPTGPPTLPAVLRECQNKKNAYTPLSKVIYAKGLLEERERIVRDNLGGVWNKKDWDNVNAALNANHASYQSNGPVTCTPAPNVPAITNLSSVTPPAGKYTNDLVSKCNALQNYQSYVNFPNTNQVVGARDPSGGLDLSKGCNDWFPSISHIECQRGWTAKNGKGAIELDSDRNMCINQTFNNVPVGMPMTVSTYYWNRSCNSSSGFSIQLNATVIKSVDPGNSHCDKNAFSGFVSQTFTAPSSSFTISFCGEGVSDGLGAVVDDMLVSKDVSAVNQMISNSNAYSEYSAALATHNALVQNQTNLIERKSYLDRIANIDGDLMSQPNGLCVSSTKCYTNDPQPNITSTDPELLAMLAINQAAYDVAAANYARAVAYQNSMINGRDKILQELYGANKVTDYNSSGESFTCSGASINKQPRYNGVAGAGGLEERLLKAKDERDALTCAIRHAQSSINTATINYNNAVAELDAIEKPPTSTGFNYCDFRFTPYPAGKEHFRLWDTIDCKISKYLGIGDYSNDRKAPVGILIFMASVLSSKLGVFIFLLGVASLVFIVMLTARVVHIYLMAFIGLIFLMFIAPLVIPTVLFKTTKNMFGRWFTQVIAMTIQPVVMFAFLSFSFIIFDLIFYGDNRSFDSDTNRIVLNSSNECEDIDTLACFYRQSSLGLDQTVKFTRTPEVFKFSLVTVEYAKDKDFIILIEVIKLIAVCFIIHSLLGTVEELIAHLTGAASGGASRMSAAPVGSPADIISTVASVTRKAVLSPFSAAKAGMDARANFKKFVARKTANDIIKYHEQAKKEEKAMQERRKRSKKNEDEEK